MKKRQLLLGLMAFTGMLILILDSKTAITGTQEGVMLCLQTVVPALFPFFLLSGLILQVLPAFDLKFLRYIERLFGIPQGSGVLFVIGLLSGYPVGAQLVTQAYQTKQISEESAKRMLGFCSNAGPAFLFGMLSPMFTLWYVPWVLWGIHILGACVAGLFFRSNTDKQQVILTDCPMNAAFALQNAVKNMAFVCGWVIIFRVILAFCKRWFLWLLPNVLQVFFYGLLELSNGCTQLSAINAESTRFLIAGLFLSFGGVCVMLQTSSVTGALGLGKYQQGKLIQSVVTAAICLLITPVLFLEDCNPIVNISLPILLIGLLIVCRLIRKKVVAFPGKMLYNTGNLCKKGAVSCCFERKSIAPAATVKEALP